MASLTSTHIATSPITNKPHLAVQDVFGPDPRQAPPLNTSPRPRMAKSRTEPPYPHLRQRASHNTPYVRRPRNSKVYESFADLLANEGAQGSFTDLDTEPTGVTLSSSSGYAVFGWVTRESDKSPASRRESAPAGNTSEFGDRRYDADGFLIPTVRSPSRCSSIMSVSPAKSHTNALTPVASVSPEAILCRSTSLTTSRSSSSKRSARSTPSQSPVLAPTKHLHFDSDETPSVDMWSIVEDSDGDDDDEREVNLRSLMERHARVMKPSNKDLQSSIDSLRANLRQDTKAEDPLDWFKEQPRGRQGWFGSNGRKSNKRSENSPPGPLSSLKNMFTRKSSKPACASLWDPEA